MRSQISDLKFQTIVAGVSAFLSIALLAQDRRTAGQADTATNTNQTHAIDLATTLRLAGAQNLDIQIARQKLREAQAAHTSAISQFFPWLAPGAGFRRHEDRLQDVVGNVFDADKQSYTAGAMIVAQWEFGLAIYESLAAKQLVNAAREGLEAQRQETTLAAAHGYFDLLLMQAGVEVANESIRILDDYHAQVQRAVEAGIAFKGDSLRVQVQAERNRLAQWQAFEQQRLAAARLAQTLHLNPAIELQAATAELVPLALIATNAALASLVQQALVSRPETKQSAHAIAAAKSSRDGAVYGPLIPSVSAQAFFGGFGGGRGSDTGNFGSSEDYALTLSWRLGPGGLFDPGRKQLREARLQATRLGQEKLEDEITRQVVEAFTRWQLLGDQIVIAERALKAAETSLQLAKDRKEFGVGIVLETIQAEQDLTRVRLDYLRAIVEFNKAQFAVSKATGKLPFAP